MEPRGIDITEQHRYTERREGKTRGNKTEKGYSTCHLSLGFP
jgi:hypothetical protein